MALSLTEFLVRLTRESELLAEFHHEPERTMQRLGVSADDQEILLSHDRQRLQDAVEPSELDDEELDYKIFWL